MSEPSTYRIWTVGWLGMLLLALLNGTLRAAVVQPRLGEETARRAATLLLLAALTAYVRGLHRRHPIATARQAWVIGLTWVAMTLSFEFGFGRLVAGLSWSTMLADYDVTADRIWVLLPAWTAAAPEVMRRKQAHPRLVTEARAPVRCLPPRPAPRS